MRTLLVLATLLSGCATIRTHRTFEVPPKGETQSRRYEFVAFALKPMTRPVPLNELCPRGWDDVVTYKSAVQSFLTVLSLDLYSPWTVEVTCRR